MDFSDKLKRVMFDKGAKGVWLAEKTGISPGKISKLRTGLYKPTPEEIVLISKALACELMELLPDVELPEDEEERLAC